MLKKILPTIVLGCLLAALLLPAAVLAQEGPPDKCSITRNLTDAECPDGSTTPVDCGEDSCVGATDPDNWGLCCTLNTIYTVTDWLFYIMLLIAVVMAVVGGFMYMTAAGDPEKAGKGKSVLIFAMIGLAIAVFSKAIPSIVRAVMGM